MTDQLPQIDRSLVATPPSLSDFAALWQPGGQVQLKAAVDDLTGQAGGDRNTTEQDSKRTELRAAPGPPTGTWQRIEATTDEGIKDFVPGLKHAVTGDIGGLVKKAAISAAIGFGGKIILSETGPLGRVASIGMGAYFTISSLVPVVHAYKTGIDTGNTRLAGEQLGDALGGALAGLPVAAGSYWAGARLGGAVMGLDSMSGLAAWKESKLSPINYKLSSLYSRMHTAIAAAPEIGATEPAPASLPPVEASAAIQAPARSLTTARISLEPLPARPTAVETAGGGSVPEVKPDLLAILAGRLKRQTLSAVSTRIGAEVAPAKPGFEVVLSASGAETTAHIGFLQALEDKHIPITSIIGASGGSLAATFYANGYSAAQMRTIFLSPEFRTPSPFVMADCLHVTDPWNLFPYSMDFKPWLQDVVKRYNLKPQPNLRIVAADSITHEPTVFEGTDYDLPTALAASTAATPAMNLKPVLYNGHTLIDGFYYHPIPAALAKNAPALVSKIGFTTQLPTELLSPWDYLLHLKEMLSSADQAKQYPDPPGHIIATTGLPDVAMTAFGISTETLEKLIDHGYQATTERLEQPDAVAAIAKREGSAVAPPAVSNLK